MRHAWRTIKKGTLNVREGLQAAEEQRQQQHEWHEKSQSYAVILALPKDS